MTNRSDCLSKIFVLMGKRGTGKDSVYKKLLLCGLRPMVGTMNIDLNRYNYLVVGVIETYEGLCEKYGRDVIVPIYLEVDGGTRFQRILDQERKKEHPKYEKLCQSFIDEAKDYSEERLGMVGIDDEYRFQNENLCECIRKIGGFIRENIR